MAARPRPGGDAQRKTRRLEKLRTPMHPPMPAWLAQPAARAPPIAPFICHDVPKVFGVLDAKLSTLRAELGAKKLRELEREFLSIDSTRRLDADPHAPGAMLLYMAARRWMRARGEELLDDDEEPDQEQPPTKRART